MKIKVTAKDIRDGKAGNSRKCPIGLAIARALGVNPDDYDEYTYAVQGFFINLGDDYEWEMPDKVWKFIDMFDNFGLVPTVPRPFSFVIPKYALRAGGLT